MARFYKSVEPDPRLFQLYTTLSRVGIEFSRRGFPARAARVRVVVDQLQAELRAQAVKSSEFADRAIQSQIDATASGRPRRSNALRDAILSQPTTSPLPSGAFGIGNLDWLDTRAPYWLVQEIGTGRSDPVTGISIPSQIGRRSRGFFQPGDSRPSASQFRVHPVFRHEVRRGVAMMVVKREIEPRGFMADGAAAALVHHDAQVERIYRDALAGLRRA